MPAPVTAEPKASETPRLTAVIERHPRSGATIGGAKKQMHKLRPEVADPKDAKSPVASLRFLAVRRRADGGTIPYRDLRPRRLSAYVLCRAHSSVSTGEARWPGQIPVPPSTISRSSFDAIKRARHLPRSSWRPADSEERTGVRFEKERVYGYSGGAKALPGRPLAPAIAPIRGSRR